MSILQCTCWCGSFCNTIYICSNVDIINDDVAKNTKFFIVSLSNAFAM